MKIPSCKKIEKQVSAYLSSFQYAPETQKTLDLLEKQHGDLCREWTKIREKYCSGEPCICKTHPRHEEFFDKINALDHEMKKIHTIRMRAAKQKEKELLLARAAKMRYLKAHIC
jgi:hypothetical protein